ncbi:MAG: hypothetical protein M3P98_01430 [bacterium]|nr:hypothetical protein [bacterium]
MENINDFVGIAIVGSGISLVLDYIKAKWGTESSTTKLLVIGLSIVCGGAYYFLQDTVLWQTILGVLAAASTFWALFLKK